MGNMYTDIERSIQQTFKAKMTVLGYTYPYFNNMISKKDIKDQHAGLSVMKISDVFKPANGGGTKSFIRTPVLDSQQRIIGLSVQEWPDPFDLLYGFTVIADRLDDCRKLDQLIRDTLRPQKRMMLWDSTANGGQGAFTDKYVEYQYAGYINRDVPADSTYWRVSNIRFECYNYQETVINEPVISEVDFSFVLSQLLTENQVVLPPMSGFIFAGVPQGARDGVNRDFTLASIPPDPSKVLVFYNGAQTPAIDERDNSVNWTIVGNTLRTVNFLVHGNDNFFVMW